MLPLLLSPPRYSRPLPNKYETVNSRFDECYVCLCCLYQSIMYLIILNRMFYHKGYGYLPVCIFLFLCCCCYCCWRRLWANTYNLYFTIFECYVGCGAGIWTEKDELGSDRSIIKYWRVHNMLSPVYSWPIARSAQQLVGNIKTKLFDIRTQKKTNV